MGKYKYCPKCGAIIDTSFNDIVCDFCKTDLIETDMDCNLVEYSSHKEEINQQIYDKYKIKENPLYDESFVEKRKEHDEKIHQRSMKIPVRQQNKPKCPICQSTNLSKISNTKKVGKIALFGIFGTGDIGKTWKCNNCGSKF